MLALTCGLRTYSKVEPNSPGGCIFRRGEREAACGHQAAIPHIGWGVFYLTITLRTVPSLMCSMFSPRTGASILRPVASKRAFTSGLAAGAL